MNGIKTFLVLNSGSSSEKFSLYEGENELKSLYFEDASDKFSEAKAVFESEGLINENRPLDGIVVRIVASGKYFAKNHIVDEETFYELEKASTINPLHVPSVIRDIKNAQVAFPEVPVIIISDSEVLMRPSRKDFVYALPERIIDEFGFGRFGAHGSSYGYIIGKMKELGILEKRTVVCHLGSGCSVTAFVDGEPTYTSMGETPLEGLMSSTRSGSIDPTIGALLGEKLGAMEAIRILNIESGLLALAGTHDTREIIAGNERGDKKSVLAYNMFVDKVVGKIGEFAAKMSGIDTIVFTATIGERSVPIRTSVISRLEFMGFRIKENAEIDRTLDYTNVAEEGSKPIYVIPTNEAAYMIKKAKELIDGVE